MALGCRIRRRKESIPSIEHRGTGDWTSKTWRFFRLFMAGVIQNGKTKMKKLLVVPLILLALVSNSHASEKAIDELFNVTNMDEQMNLGFEAMMPMIDQMAMRFKLDVEQKEELKNIYRTWFKEDFDQSKVVNEVKSLYVETFTEDEIEQVTEFFKTPVGKKFINKSPELMQRGARIGMAEGQAKEHKLMERIRPFLEKHNIK